MVKINGENENVAGVTVEEYVDNSSYDKKRIVIEYNKVILPKEEYSKTVLSDGDTLEIVTFVGGG